MLPTNTTISSLLGLDASPESLLAWHQRIVEGFPAAAMKTLAANVGVSPKDLAAAVGTGTLASKKALAPEVSNGLYRVAVIFQQLTSTFAADTAVAAKWLTSANAGLRGRVPLKLLSTSLGFDYVCAAIARERVA